MLVMMDGHMYSALDIINVDLSLISKLEGALAVFLAKCVCLVDLGVFGEFSVCFYYSPTALAVEKRTTKK